MRLAAIILTLAAVLPQDAFSQQLVGIDELPSADYKWCELHDGYLYAAVGPALQIFDVSNPANLVEVAQTQAYGLAGPPAFVDDYAYVPFGGSVRLFDVSNPSAPVVLGVTNVTYSGAKDNAPSRGHKALVYDDSTQRLYYVGSRNFPFDHWGARIYDVADPESPALLVEDDSWFIYPTFDETGEIVDYLVIGSRIYLHSNSTVDGSYGNDIQVIDATNPGSGTLPSLGYWYLGEFRANCNIVSDGSTVYGPGLDEVRAYTIESDGTLTLAGTLPLGGGLPLFPPTGLFLDDATTLVVTTANETHFVDVTDPGSMQISATEPISSVAEGYRAQRSGDTVFSPHRTWFEVATIAAGGSSPQAELMGAYRPETMAASGDHLFLGTNSGLWAVNVTAGSFGDLHSIDPSGRDGPVAVLANGSLVQEYYDALRIYDVADVTQPALLAEEPDVLTIVNDVAADGNYVAVIGTQVADRQIALWDLGNPANPNRKGSEIVASWNTTDLRDVELVLPAAYVAHGGDLWVIDCSNVNNLAVETSFTVGGTALRIFRTGSLLFVSTGLHIYVYDITNPLDPVQVNDLFLGSALTAGVVEVDGYHAIAHGTSVWLLDLSDPTSEVYLGQVPRRVEDGALAVLGGCAYDLSFQDVVQSLEVNASTAVEPFVDLDGSILLAAYPNPSDGRTSIRWSSGVTGPVELSIYDAAGRRVRQWASPAADPFFYEWDGHDAFGQPVARGVYYYRLTTRQGTQTQRLVKVR